MRQFDEGLNFFNSERFILLDYGTGNIPEPEEWNNICRYHPFHMFYYIVKGCVELHSTTTHSTTTMTPGSSFLIPAGTYDFLCKEPSTLFAAHFFCPLKNGGDLMADYSGTIIPLEISEQDYALKNILRCFKERKIADADIILLKGLLHQIVGQVMKRYPSVSTFSRPQELSEVSRQVISYVRQNLSSQLKVQHIATETGFHPNYLSKRFYAENGITLKRYIDTQLYQRALILLTTSSKSVQEISKELRFSSPYYFSNFIKKFLGYSPEKFRKIQGTLRPIVEIE